MEAGMEAGQGQKRDPLPANTMGKPIVIDAPAVKYGLLLDSGEWPRPFRLHGGSLVQVQPVEMGAKEKFPGFRGDLLTFLMKTGHTRSAGSHNTQNGVCLLCNKAVTIYNGSYGTGPLHSHLNSRHCVQPIGKLRSTTIKGGTSRQRVAHAAQSINTTGTVNTTEWTFSEKLPHHVKLTQWLVLNARPFNLTQDRLFIQHQLNISAGLYRPPHQKTIRQLVKIMQSLTLLNINKAIQRAISYVSDAIPFLGLYMDTWTSCANDTYISIDASFHDPTDPQSLPISNVTLHMGKVASHNANALALEVANTFSRFGLQAKPLPYKPPQTTRAKGVEGQLTDLGHLVRCMTSDDGGGVMLNAAKELHVPRDWCALHKYDLPGRWALGQAGTPNTRTPAMQEARDFMTRMTKMVTHFHSSSQSQDALKTKATELLAHWGQAVAACAKGQLLEEHNRRLDAADAGVGDAAAAEDVCGSLVEDLSLTHAANQPNQAQQLRLQNQVIINANTGQRYQLHLVGEDLMESANEVAENSEFGYSESEAEGVEGSGDLGFQDEPNFEQAVTANKEQVLALPPTSGGKVVKLVSAGSTRMASAFKMLKTEVQMRKAIRDTLEVVDAQLLCPDTDWKEAAQICGLGAHLVDAQMRLQSESISTKPADWLLGNQIVESLQGRAAIPAIDLADSNKTVSVPIAELCPIAASVRETLIDKLNQVNGVLPSETQIAAALLSPHTRLLMQQKLNKSDEGKQLLQRVWQQIQDDVEAVLTAELTGESVPSDNLLPTPSMDVEETHECTPFDPFGTALDPELEEAMIPTASHNDDRPSFDPKMLALQEMTLWRSPVNVQKVKKSKGGETHNYKSAGLLDFDALSWWANPQHKNRYRGLRKVAMSYLVVHATAARNERNFSWAGIVAVAKRARLTSTMLSTLVFLKCNHKYWPSQQEIIDEYKRLHAKRGKKRPRSE